MHSKTNPTPEVLAQNLKAADERCNRERNRQRERVTSGVDALIELLKFNRERIGAYMIIVRGEDGGNIVDPETGEASRGATILGVPDKDSLMVIQVHAEDLVAELKAERMWPGAGLSR